MYEWEELVKRYATKDKPRGKRVAVFSTSPYELDGIKVDFEVSLIQFIETMQSRLESIPEEYRHTAQIEYDSGWEAGDGKYVCWYTRPETEAEAVQRLRAEAETAADLTRRERENYERLKRKFEP